MRQEFQNPDEQANDGSYPNNSQTPPASGLGQFPQDQNQYQGVQTQQAPPEQAWSPGLNTQSPYSQPPAQQTQYPPQQFQQNPYAQQQNPYSQQQAPQSQHQYPTGYNQNQYAQQTFRSSASDEYLSYDQKASRMVAGTLGALLLAAVAIGLIWVYKATHFPPVPAPTAYTTFTVGDGYFSIAQPVGWSTDSGGANGVESNATFKNGKAKIYADSDLGGSLNGDILAATNAQQQNIADELNKKITITPPVVTIHREGAAQLAQQYANYNEQPMQQFDCGLGQGWYSEFTANAGTFTGNVHGYRATVLSNDRRISAVLVCRESDWAALSAPYMHVLESMDRGKTAQ